MEVVVKQIRGWQREVQGLCVVLDVDVGGTIRDTLRLTLPTDVEVSALRKILSDALSDWRGRGPEVEKANTK